MRRFAAYTAPIVLGIAATANAQVYDFTITPGASGLDGTLATSAEAVGTLSGDYDPATNPAGTRTKPGLFGTFGSTENLPVPASLSVAAGGPVATSTTGSFTLALDPVSGTLAMTNFAADFLGGDSLELPITLGLLFDSFRTRAPTAAYPGGVPVQLPLGTAALTSLVATQQGGASGTLTPTGSGSYDFAIAAVLLASGSFTALGTGIDLPAQAVPLGLAGSIAVTSSGATLASLAPLALTSAASPALELPELPLALPTLLPPGAAANLLLDLTLTRVALDVDASAAFTATGVAVPLPGASWLLATGLAVLGARRRWRARPGACHA